MERREVACSGGGDVSLLSCSNSSSSGEEDGPYHCVYFQKDSIKRRIEEFC